MAISDIITAAYNGLKSVASKKNEDRTPDTQVQVPQNIQLEVSQNLSLDPLIKWAENELVKLAMLPICEAVLLGLTVLKGVAKVDKRAVPLILVGACDLLHPVIEKAIGYSFDCEYMQGDSIQRGNTGKSFTNVLTLMDTMGDDGKALRYYLMGLTQCGKPDTPYIDTSKLGWYPPKPDNITIAPSSNETFNVLHISDFHLDLKYQIGAESQCDYYMCCTDLSKNQTAINAGFHDPLIPAQSMGTYQCDCPQSLMEDSLQNVVDINKDKKFEFGIFTGDMVAHDPDEYYSKQNVQDNEEQAYKNLKQYLGDLPIYATFGNHDTYPNSQFAQDKSGFGGEFQWNTDLVTGLWKDYGWIDEAEASNAAHTVGSFAVTTKRGLRVISLDSNFWYKMNLYNYWNIADPDPSGVFKWFVDELVESEKKGERVWVVTHVPTGGAGDGLPWSSEVMRQIIVRFSPHVIAAVFYGHTHADQFTVYYDTPHGSTDMTDPLTTGWIVQSITPVDFYNPSWRYYEVDSKTFEIMDSKNYYTQLDQTFDYDLSKPYLANASSSFPHVGYEPQTPANAKWEFLYSAREAYDPHNNWPKDAPLNATFWDRVIKNIQSDPQQLETFYDNWFRKSPYTKQCSGGDCAKDTACFLAGGSWDSLYNCEGKSPIRGGE
ncbi:Metallo-dependent phosphatase-like protein [Yarrowia lipolytica]|jgi:sphingomyelin phosphodiesterase|uniref:YALI0E34485p n=2 Tax=Yarrowia lipolytica TaxID=4952 RepID=Q6C3I7_YARLI|nr:YALI0E34485p [Yarrowia lipolytica CLIB122]AOW06388.1 hypothetical protein YALI1_E40915g [Yarrowia lipolytica]KAB8282628.1 Metallo-dependent phosphatase-like protein [Yarrowia lipolytica]KAE8171162.1 Metallo-dependent phosphatase-like protein [Yarrowia lipolytica]KAJ8057757.1 Metallo-dependent phosphatase-like protein [Yarrowia lipolytica]QNQ00954.1 Sphingomyelin phosphodiesterase 2 [Yarrowia lipolytica]|eukprot:XP_504775.1 YALI0E34485p [Yarrowia lipolytica CLIB122]